MVISTLLLMLKKYKIGLMGLEERIRKVFLNGIELS